MGHLMRCIALAEEAVARGWTVGVYGDLEANAVQLIGALVPQVQVVPDPAADWTGLSPDLVHIDTYLDLVVPDGPWLVSAMQDGPFGARAAELAIDANLGAEAHFEAPSARHALVGVSAVPIRRGVRAQMASVPGTAEPRRVLVVMGGTDPFSVTPRVVSALETVTRPLEVTVVTPEPVLSEVEEAAARSRHHVMPVPFLADLPAVAARQDLVISAAGTSVWDFACMGVPMALLCVTDNQVAGYRAVLEAGLALGLGEPPHADLPTRMAAVAETLANPGALVALHDRGRRIVDGLGAWRVVSAWEQLLAARGPTDAPPERALTARSAVHTDARQLLEWRNDPLTRAGSRSADEVAWADHVAWLEQVLGAPDRQLYVVESEDSPVGTVRWDRRAGADWEVSITVAPQVRGRGLALPILRAGEEALDVTGGARLIATVHQDNVASRRLFERAGYLPLTPPDEHGFATSMRWRASSTA